MVATWPGARPARSTCWRASRRPSIPAGILNPGKLGLCPLPSARSAVAVGRGPPRLDGSCDRRAIGSAGARAYLIIAVPAPVVLRRKRHLRRPASVVAIRCSCARRVRRRAVAASPATAAPLTRRYPVEANADRRRSVLAGWSRRPAAAGPPCWSSLALYLAIVIGVVILGHALRGPDRLIALVAATDPAPGTGTPSASS